ncbi:hypothetical protein CDL12_29392 [Handroanthus impetiginosus]|uniref:Cotton fiber protein n=1 Tax=Handroanthus impetiginosus TaxID=429701 RepID=A0A2G9FYH6_9LAMI|nr:hypothetical protein CDL12_29392 [Handroanthus impetiginosus]
MGSPSSLKSPKSLNLFSTKSPYSSSSTSIKLKTLFQTTIISHISHLSRNITKAKSLLVRLFRNTHFTHLLDFPLKKNKNNKQRTLFFGSFRLHYNWCSSHVMPVSQESHLSSHFYYDPNWNSVVPTSFDCHEQENMQDYDDGLSRYLEWLEEKGNDQENPSSNEIDKLADLFIANCHEKFRLEKQESYRRFQEMMARSV